MVRRGWLIVGEPLLAIRRFSTGGPTETYRRLPMTLVGHWWADSDKPTATCRPLPPLAHQSNAIWDPSRYDDPASDTDQDIISSSSPLSALPPVPAELIMPPQLFTHPQTHQETERTPEALIPLSN